MEPFAVLIFGKDAHLLETRQWVLEAAGYRVRAAADLLECDRALSTSTFQLFILCHSIALEECGRALALASSRSPTMKSLVLQAGMSNCHHGLLSVVLNAMDGPAKMISTVDALTGRNSSPHSHTY